MEEAAVHAADGLAAEPLLLLIAVCAVLLVLVGLYAVKSSNDNKKLQIEADTKFREKQQDIEQDREARKMEEAKQRNEREKENAVLMRASIEAQERSTVAINESTAQMAALMAKLEVSQQGSAAMKDTMDGVATEVHDIHRVIVK